MDEFGCKARSQRASGYRERKEEANPEVVGEDNLKRAVLYSRISTGDQHLETQLLDLRELAKQRGFEIVGEYTDVISGAKSKRPGLERLMADARRRRFDVVLVAAFDRIALVVERVKSGMRRAKLEGRQIGRSRLDVNRQQVIQDRRSGMSLTKVAKKHGISRASVCRLMKEATSNPDAPVPALAGNTPEQASAASGAQ